MQQHNRISNLVDSNLFSLGKKFHNKNNFIVLMYKRNPCGLDWNGTGVYSWVVLLPC